MKPDKKIIGLLALLALIAGFAYPKISGNSTDIPTKQETVSSNKDANEKKSDDATTNKNSSKKKKNSKKTISKDKLEVDKLLPKQANLESLENGGKAFINLSEVAANQKKMMEENLRHEKENSQPMIAENLEIPSVADMNPIVPETPKNSETNNMVLKAIAQSGNKVIAIIDAGGKKITAFVGSMVGSNYIVTDIEGDHVRLQSLSGETATLKLAR